MTDLGNTWLPSIKDIYFCSLTKVIDRHSISSSTALNRFYPAFDICVQFPPFFKSRFSKVDDSHKEIKVKTADRSVLCKRVSTLNWVHNTLICIRYRKCKNGFSSRI